MKKTFYILSLFAFALCFFSFGKEEKVVEFAAPPIIYSIMQQSPQWHKIVHEESCKVATVNYTDYIGNAITDPNSNEAKRVEYSKRILNSKPSDGFNLYLVNFFTNSEYISTSNLTDTDELTTSLRNNIATQFDNLAGVAP